MKSSQSALMSDSRRAAVNLNSAPEVAGVAQVAPNALLICKRTRPTGPRERRRLLSASMRLKLDSPFKRRGRVLMKSEVAFAVNSFSKFDMVVK